MGATRGTIASDERTSPVTFYQPPAPTPTPEAVEAPDSSPTPEAPTVEDRLARLEAAVFPHVARAQASEQDDAA